ncbi:MAG: dienelactone hydrolase family protein [Candidatus Lustribacter sp.]
MSTFVRAVMAAGLFAIAFLATSAPAWAEKVTIPPQGALPAISGDMQRPAGPGPFPAVLVLHGCEGPSAVAAAAEQQLVQQGYVALAIDTLAPQGMKNACANATASVIANSARYAYVALGWLATQPFVSGDRLGVVGFSMGAIEILGLIDPLEPHAPPPGLRAAVAYYPACGNRSPNVSVPLQILDGAADDWNIPEPCQRLAADATAAGKTVLITTYPGVTHDFNQPADATRTYLGHTLRYDAAATKDAAAKTAAFLATYLK